MDWFSGERETKTIVTCFDRNETSHLRIHRLSERIPSLNHLLTESSEYFCFSHVKSNRGCYVPSYMGSKMRVVIAPGGGRLATDATNVGFLPSMHL